MRWLIFQGNFSKQSKSNALARGGGELELSLDELFLHPSGVSGLKFGSSFRRGKKLTYDFFILHIVFQLCH